MHQSRSSAHTAWRPGHSSVHQCEAEQSVAASGKARGRGVGVHGPAGGPGCHRGLLPAQASLPAHHTAFICLYAACAEAMCHKAGKPIGKCAPGASHLKSEMCTKQVTSSHKMHASLLISDLSPMYQPKGTIHADQGFLKSIHTIVGKPDKLQVLTLHPTPVPS